MGSLSQQRHAFVCLLLFTLALIPARVVAQSPNTATMIVVVVIQPALS